MNELYSLQTRVLESCQNEVTESAEPCLKLLASTALLLVCAFDHAVIQIQSSHAAFAAIACFILTSSGLIKSAELCDSLTERLIFNNSVHLDEELCGPVTNEQVWPWFRLFQNGEKKLQAFANYLTQRQLTNCLLEIDLKAYGETSMWLTPEESKALIRIVAEKRRTVSELRIKLWHKLGDHQKVFDCVSEILVFRPPPAYFGNSRPEPMTDNLEPAISEWTRKCLDDYVARGLQSHQGFSTLQQLEKLQKGYDVLRCDEPDRNTLEKALCIFEELNFIPTPKNCRSGERAREMADH